MEFIQHDAAFGWRSKSAPHVSVGGQIKHSLSVNKLDVGGLLRLLLAPFVVEVPHLCGWQAATTIHVEQIARVKCIYPQDLYATLTVVLLTPRLFYKKKTTNIMNCFMEPHKPDDEFTTWSLPSRDILGHAYKVWLW